jgi:hypothetical protein
MHFITYNWLEHSGHYMHHIKGTHTVLYALSYTPHLKQ